MKGMSFTITAAQAKDWAAIVFGFAAFLFSWFAHRRARAAESRSDRAEARSILNEEQALEMKYLQEKQDGILALYEVRLVADRLQLALEDVRQRATKVGAEYAAEQSTARLADCLRLGALAEAQRETIDALPTHSASHDDLMKLKEINVVIQQIRSSRVEMEKSVNGMIAEFSTSITLHSTLIDRFNTARQRVLCTTLSNELPAVLHEIRDFIIIAGWSERSFIRPFFDKWLNRTPVALGLPALGVFTQEEVAELFSELRSLEIP